MNLLILFWGVLLPIILTYLALGNETATNVIALSAGVTAFCLMAINLFLATRPPVIERWIGGLDRLYFTHKWIGISVLVLACVHHFVGMDLDGEVLTRGTARTAAEAAELVFPLLVALIFISFLKRLPRLKFEIPWDLWRWSHRALGLVFLVLVFHQLFVKAPVQPNSLLSDYLLWAAALGVASFIYTQAFALFRRRAYVVSAIEKAPAATVLELCPEGRPLRTRPGNFAFLSARRAGLREPHPFTVSGVGPNEALQFSIRGAGDFTRRIGQQLQVGDKVRLEGGYGRFEFHPTCRAQIWVAGGIGVTPFLTFADAITGEQEIDIHMFYSVRDASDALGLDRLHAAAIRNDGFRFTLYESRANGRFNAEQLVALSKVDPAKAKLWFCGPMQMRVSLGKDLKTLGKNPLGMNYEKFEFRSIRRVGHRPACALCDRRSCQRRQLHRR